MPDSDHRQGSSSSPFDLHQGTGRGLVIFLIKVVIATGLLYWLASSGRLEFSHLRNISWSLRTVGLVIMGVGAVITGLMLLGLRLRLMVRSVGIELSFLRAFSLTAIGAFSGSILPGVVGGDIIKVVYLCREEASTQRTFATVAVMCDRTVGLFSLFLLGSIVSVAAWATNSLPFRSPVFLMAPAIVLLITGGVAVYSRRRLSGEVSWGRWGKYVPSRIQRAVSIGDHFSQRPRLLAGCIGLSLANHILVCCTFLIGAELLGGIDISSLQQFLLNPLAMVMNVIPITPGGVGVAESAFSYLYDAAGIPLGATLGIVGRTIQYIAFIAVGFPALIFRGK